MVLVFKEDFKTGVHQLDKQHKELFDKVNKLYQACVEGRKKEEVSKIIKNLEQLINFHIQTEEKLMEQNNYPKIKSHKSEHKLFKQNYDFLKTMFEEKGCTTDFIVKVNNLMISRLIEHLNSEDKYLANFLSTKIH